MNNKKIFIILVILLSISILGNGYLLVQRQSLKNIKSEKELALVDANKQLTELQSSVTDLQSQIQELQTKTTETDTTSNDTDEIDFSFGGITQIDGSEEAFKKIIESNNTENEQISQEQKDSYTVEKGDTLATISMKIYGNKDMVEKICELNNMINDNDLKEGIELLLP